MVLNRWTPRDYNRKIGSSKEKKRWRDDLTRQIGPLQPSTDTCAINPGRGSPVKSKYTL